MNLRQTFCICTDCNTLKWLHSSKIPKSQGASWLEKLAEFDFEVEHQAGEQHGNADAMLCWPWPEKATYKNELVYHIRHQLQSNREMGPVSGTSGNQELIRMQLEQWSPMTRPHRKNK